MRGCDTREAAAAHSTRGHSTCLQAADRLLRRLLQPLLLRLQRRHGQLLLAARRLLPPYVCQRAPLAPLVATLGAAATRRAIVIIIIAATLAALPVRPLHRHALHLQLLPQHANLSLAIARRRVRVRLPRLRLSQLRAQRSRLVLQIQEFARRCLVALRQQLRHSATRALG